MDPVYVEISPLLYPELTGIGRFTARLVEALASKTPVRLVRAIQGELAPKVELAERLPYGYEIVIEPRDVPWSTEGDIEAWVQELLRRQPRPHDTDLASRSAGVYTWTRPPERHFRRELCILYDFTPVLLPWAHLPLTRTHFGQLFAQTIALCDKVVALSASTKFDASYLGAIPSSDVVLVYPGPSLCPSRHASPEAVAREKQTILVVSTLEPRKNSQFLLDWFASTRALPDGSELWWVGPTGWLHSKPKAVQKVAPDGRTIRFLGRVSDRRLCELYRQVGVTIYPSLYEGFGFPVLDSLLHGTPVLTSFHSSLQEFAGDGVYYFDPCDAHSLDVAYEEQAQSATFTIHRADLRERCSWEGLARTVLSLCE